MAKENNNEFGIAGFTLSIVAIISAGGGMGLILSILSFIFLHNTTKKKCK
jgi:hypothetical protein